jgi:hypothetical protein
MRLAGTGRLAAAGTAGAPKRALPNQFRCQTSKPFRLTEKARPWAVENLPDSTGLSPNRRHHVRWRRSGNSE